MATTSRALAPGKPRTGRGGRHTGQWVAALAAATALVLALVVGNIAIRERQADVAPGAAPAGAATSGEFIWDDYAAAQVWPLTGVASISGPWIGACRAGGSECLPDEPIVPGVLPTGPVSIPGPWRGTCRAGGSDCLPDEPIVPGGFLPAVTHGAGPADEYDR